MARHGGGEGRRGRERCEGVARGVGWGVVCEGREAAVALFVVPVSVPEAVVIAVMVAVTVTIRVEVRVWSCVRGEGRKLGVCRRECCGVEVE